MNPKPPERRANYEYRIDVARGSIAALKDGEWHRVACKTIAGEWFEQGDLLIDGKRVPFTADMTV